MSVGATQTVGGDATVRIAESMRLLRMDVHTLL